MQMRRFQEPDPAVEAPSPTLPIRHWAGSVRFVIQQAGLVLAVSDRSGTSHTAPQRSTTTADPPASSATSGGASFHTIVLPHLDAAYNLARFLTRDADAADDIVQEAFLRAFRTFSGFRGGDSRAWLLTIVRNCVRGWANERTNARQSAEPGKDPSPANTSVDAALKGGEIRALDPDTPEMALLRACEVRTIRGLIEALPETFREALILREFDELSYKQIAAVTGVPIGTVMSRLARARDMFGHAWRRQSQDDER